MINMLRRLDQTSIAKDGKIRLGIWGPPRAGKTTYLAMLYHTAANFGCRMLPLNDDSRDFLMDVYSQLIDERKFPNPNEESKLYEFGLDIPGFLGFGHREIILGFIDAPGEVFTNPEQAAARGMNASEVFEFLRSSMGLICLIDPEPLHIDSYFKSMLHLLYQLTPRETQDRIPDYIHQNIAFVLTKMDLKERWEKREQPKEYAMETLGRASLRLVVDYCAPNRYRFFAASSIGRITGTETGKDVPNLVEERNEAGTAVLRIYDTEAMQPYGVFEPIQWLLG